MKELSKDSKFSISVETLVILGGVIVTVVGMWFTLQSEISEAKKLKWIDIDFERKCIHIHATKRKQ